MRWRWFLTQKEHLLSMVLDSGIYYLKETKAPVGYRPLLDPIVLNLEATFTDGRNIYVKGDGATDKTLQENLKQLHILKSS